MKRVMYTVILIKTRRKKMKLNKYMLIAMSFVLLNSKPTQGQEAGAAEEKRVASNQEAVRVFIREMEARQDKIRGRMSEMKAAIDAKTEEARIARAREIKVELLGIMKKVAKKMEKMFNLPKEEKNIQPGELLCFGDGFPEILNTYQLQ